MIVCRFGPRIARTFDRTSASATRPRSLSAVDGPGEGIAEASGMGVVSGPGPATADSGRGEST